MRLSFIYISHRTKGHPLNSKQISSKQSASLIYDQIGPTWRQSLGYLRRSTDIRGVMICNPKYTTWKTVTSIPEKVNGRHLRSLWK